MLVRFGRFRLERSSEPKAHEVRLIICIVCAVESSGYNKTRGLLLMAGWFWRLFSCL